MIGRSYLNSAARKMVNPRAYGALNPYKFTHLMWPENVVTRPLLQCSFLYKYFSSSNTTPEGVRTVFVEASLAYVYESIRVYHNMHTDCEIRTKRIQQSLWEIYAEQDLGDAIKSMYAMCADKKEFVASVQSLIEPYILKQFDTPT